MIKQVGTVKYAHKSNITELVDKCFTKDVEKQMFLHFLERAMYNGYSFDVVKYDRGSVTLITSPDWNTANEPIVGYCYRWELQDWASLTWSPPVVRKNFKQIYHNKWMFVASDYKGFDIAQAKRRSELWNSLPDIKEVKNKIGYKEFWVQYLAKYGLEL